MTVTTDSPPAGVSNGELIRWVFERLNERDTAPLRPLWTEETLHRFPDRTCVGEQEIAAYFERAFAALPDWHMELVHLAEQGDDVYVHWKLTGTHTGGSFQGIEPTGKRVTIDGMDHFVLRDGKTVSNFVVFDQLQFARQIGLIPEDGSSPDRAMKLAFNAKTKVQARFGV